ncbi:MAG: hypothetical protein QF535_10620, partial [Anaerolineales bacterium]|nr:hypothetical protein [Anaerolineales bacterium]
DFDLDSIDIFGIEKDWTKKAQKEGAEKGFVQYGEDADCWTSAGCADYACKDHPYCDLNNYGVEGSGFVDTRVPKVIGLVKETYPDSAAIAFFTDKPANGTLSFFGNDSTCHIDSLNATINDSGISDSAVREFNLWHFTELYNDSGVNSLNYPLTASTAYYYKLKVCDDLGKCGESKCSSFTTEADANCAFCKSVVRLDMPTGWDVHYDLIGNGTEVPDGTYEHWQGNVLDTGDGMFFNYTSGRRASILLNNTAESVYLEFINVTLTKTGVGPHIRDNDDSASTLQSGTTEDTSGIDVGHAGMAEETRDKIINNLYPRTCRISVPGPGTCTELWHCDNDMTKCVDRTAEATLVASSSTSCTWQVPYCEFSEWVVGQPSGSSNEGTTSGGGNGGGGTATDDDLNATVPDVNTKDEADGGSIVGDVIEVIAGAGYWAYIVGGLIALTAIGIGVYYFVSVRRKKQI